MKKVFFVIIAVIAIIFIAGTVMIVVGRNPRSSDKSETVIITSADFEEAVDISQLSTSEFIYNGIAVKYEEDDPDEAVCHIAYNATVKVGIDMSDITFELDDEAMTVTVILPEIEINIASVKENSLSYIPRDPDIPLGEIISLCKEDAIAEANESEVLYETAEENLKSVIEALITPLLESTEYALKWGSA